MVAGLLLGIAAWRHPWFERILNPLLNIAQSLPHFAYMIPVVVFIGVGPKSGAVVTIIFAAPPMIRMTILGLKKVAGEVIESGKMCGADRLQLLWQVRVPSARTEILVGINQVIMQCLAMVVLASFIGMPGLGQKLLQLLQALKVGRSVEIGISIVLIAIMLDQCSKAWVVKEPHHFEKGTPWHERHRILLIWLGLSVLAFIAAQLWPIADQIKRNQALTVYKQIDSLVEAFIIFIDPVTQWLRGFLIRYVLIPMRDAYLWLPFTSGSGLCGRNRLGRGLPEIGLGLSRLCGSDRHVRMVGQGHDHNLYGVIRSPSGGSDRAALGNLGVADRGPVALGAADLRYGPDVSELYISHSGGDAVRCERCGGDRRSGGVRSCADDALYD